MSTRGIATLLALALLACLAVPATSHAQSETTIALGDSVRGRLETPVEVDNFRFQGGVGLRIRIRITADSGMEPAARLEVDNREVWFGGAPGGNVVDSGTLTLDSNNQYLLQIRTANNRAGGYLLETLSSDQSPSIGENGEIKPGQTVSGWLGGPSSGHNYFFFAMAGQTVILSARAGENLTPRLSLQSPSGLILWSERASGPNQPLTLPPIRLVETGMYLVYITAAGDTGGTYELSLSVSQ
ncbi:MAG: hypothetical protein HGA45_25575 [Chloroflexales bacterium]|nr:hypothetical protein [Chloroflexales bacterium]